MQEPHCIGLHFVRSADLSSPKHLSSNFPHHKMGDEKKWGEPETMPKIVLSLIESDELAIEFKPEVQGGIRPSGGSPCGKPSGRGSPCSGGVKDAESGSARCNASGGLPDSCIRLRCCPIRRKPLEVKSDSCLDSRRHPPQRALRDPSLNRLFIQGRENTVLNLRPRVSTPQATSDGTSKVTSSERNPRVRTAP
jgi:hypothetical protein